MEKTIYEWQTSLANSQSKSHFFNGDVCKITGVNAAIILQHLQFHITNNANNEHNYYDGKVWTYNSVRAFEQTFYYFTANQIRYILENLEKDGYVETGNYNKHNYDRTKWYTLTDKYFDIFTKSIRENPQMKLEKVPNDVGENPTTIPDIDTDIDSDNKDDVGFKKEETIPYKEILDYLSNAKGMKRGYGLVNGNKKDIKARWNEGYKLEDFKEVIDVKISQWLIAKPGQKDMSIYLRPSTLFSNKFDGYLREGEKNYEKSSSTNEYYTPIL